jgi:AcrR family transcriptional regulator
VTAGAGRATEDTRRRILEAAEHLFAERGVDAVSLREVNRLAGARNAIAVQYHFEDRTGVLRAIFAKHGPDVDARRHAMLDQYEGEGRADLRFLAAALVRPFAAKLADPDGGPEFLQIHAEVLSRPDGPLGSAITADEPAKSLLRWRTLVEPLLEADAARLHRRYTAILHTAVELSRRARTGPHTDDRLFVSYLIDVVTAILGAPVSEETRRLADERDASTRAPRRPRR